MPLSLSIPIPAAGRTVISASACLIQICTDKYITGPAIARALRLPYPSLAHYRLPAPGRASRGTVPAWQGMKRQNIPAPLLGAPTLPLGFGELHPEKLRGPE